MPDSLATTRSGGLLRSKPNNMSMSGNTPNTMMGAMSQRMGWACWPTRSTVRRGSSGTMSASGHRKNLRSRQRRVGAVGAPSTAAVVMPTYLTGPAFVSPRRFHAQPPQVGLGVHVGAAAGTRHGHHQLRAAPEQ